MEFLLTIFPESTAFIKPAKSSLDDPTLWKDLKFVQIIAFDNFDIRTEELLDTISKGLAHIPAITKDIYNARQRRTAELYHFYSTSLV